MAGLRSCAGSGCVPERIAYRNWDTTKRLVGTKFDQDRSGLLTKTDQLHFRTARDQNSSVHSYSLTPVDAPSPKVSKNPNNSSTNSHDN